MARKLRTIRSARPTVLIVGEGNAEVLLLKHLRGLYTSDRAGVALTIRNAHGRGAANVVDVTCGHARNAAFDNAAALLDVDTTCTEKARRNARRAGIALLEQQPCLEAWLLAVHGVISPGYSSAEYKQAFQRKFGCAAHEDGYLAVHFRRAVLDQARASVGVLHQLLALIQP